jgi:DNA polymerase-3 subunit beta
MQMVATDGHRLAKASAENKVLKGLNEDIIIPPKVLNIIPKFADGDTDTVGVIFGENNVIFNLDDVVLTSRLIEGPYPNFEQVIPAQGDKRLVISKDDLGGAVRRVSILSNALTHQVKFSIQKGSLTLSTSNADVGGEGQEVIPCDYDGEGIEIGYNAAYVLDILSKVDDDEAVMELSSSVAAGVMYSPNVSRDEFLCLIMPLRLAE